MSENGISVRRRSGATSSTKIKFLPINSALCAAAVGRVWVIQPRYKGLQDQRIDRLRNFELNEVEELVHFGGIDKGYDRANEESV